MSFLGSETWKIIMWEKNVIVSHPCQKELWKAVDSLLERNL